MAAASTQQTSQDPPAADRSSHNAAQAAAFDESTVREFMQPLPAGVAEVCAPKQDVICNALFHCCAAQRLELLWTCCSTKAI